MHVAFGVVARWVVADKTHATAAPSGFQVIRQHNSLECFTRASHNDVVEEEENQKERSRESQGNCTCTRRTPEDDKVPCLVLIKRTFD